MHKFFTFAFQHFINGNAGPFGNNRSDVLLIYSFGKTVFVLFGIFFSCFNLTFQSGNNAVLKFSRTFKPAFAFGDFHFYAGLIQLIFQIGEVCQPLFFFFPFFFQRFGLGFQS